MGQNLLLARRLIESGARFVTVLWDCFGQFGNGAWDTHQYHYPRLKELLLLAEEIREPLRVAYRLAAKKRSDEQKKLLAG